MDPLSQVATEGENVTFFCTVTGTTPFTVIWMNSSMNMLVQSSLNESLMNGTVTLALALTHVTNTSYQIYTCVGRSDNDDTFVNASATLSKLF